MLAGGVSVGAFFMLSAFGLAMGFKKNPQKYPWKILLIKIPLLYLVQVLLNLLFYVVLRPNVLAWQAVAMVFNLGEFFGCGVLNQFSWFVTTLLVFYFLAAMLMLIANKLKRRKALFICLTTFVIVLAMHLTFLIPVDSLHIYFCSILCFPLGIFYSLNFEKVNSFLGRKKVFLWCFITLSICTILSLFLPWLTGAKTEALTTYLVCPLIIVFAQKFELQSPLLSFLGKISLGIYLLQRLSFAIVPMFTTNSFVWGLTILAVTIVLGYVFQIVYDRATGLLFQLGKQNEQEERKLTE